MRIAYYLVFLCFLSKTVLAATNTSGVIYNKCLTVEIGPARIDDVCVTLAKDGNCALDGSLTIGNVPVFNQNLDLGIIPAVCGGYSPPPLFPHCSLCVGVFDDTQNKSADCLILTGSCNGAEAKPQTLGCFDKSILTNISQCRSQLCPNNCSSHGTCNNGNCSCNPGWYGEDCSSNTPFFQSCIRVSQYGDPLCAELKFFNSCHVEAGMTVGTNHILNYTMTVDNFRRGLAMPSCSSAYLCETCLSWKRLVLNETVASGCAHLSVDCFDYPTYSYEMGCYEDTSIVPLCFGKCKNDCSMNGRCDNGKCICHSEWQGEDCSTMACDLTCVHGSCNAKGECVCLEHFGGPNCDTPAESTTGDTHTSGHHSNTAAIVIPVVFFVLVGVGLGVVYWYKYKRHRTPQFRQLDLVEGESLIDDDEPSSNSRFAAIKAKLSFDN